MTADTLLAAIELQRGGRRAEAEALYRSVLTAEPLRGQALYLYDPVRPLPAVDR